MTPGVIDMKHKATMNLKKRTSLLAAGIKKVNGNFYKGDHIRILDINMQEYARGLSSFTSDEVVPPSLLVGPDLGTTMLITPPARNLILHGTVIFSDCVKSNVYLENALAMSSSCLPELAT